jgi:hypothetical protein
MRSLYAFTFISVVAAAVPAAGQTRITQSGPVPHQAAAAVFPERVGEFRRTGVVQYDAKGEDMSAGYKDLRREPTAPLPASTGVSPDLSHGANFRLRATFDKPDQDLQSTYRLHCYVGGRWLVKYRATSPYGYPAEQALEQFIRTGPWPGRGSPGNTVARPRTESAG